MASQRTLAGISIVVGLLAGAGLGEIAFRFLRPQETYSSYSAYVGEEYQVSDFIPFTLRPGYQAQAPRIDDLQETVTLTINKLGLRGPETTPDKPVNVKRILLLGDSFTFGMGVGDTSTYAAVTQRILRAKGCPVEVINGGYANGWGPDTEYAWLIHRGLQFQPDMVIYGFFNNDFDDIDSTHWVTRDARDLPTRIVDTSVYVDARGQLRSTIPFTFRTVGGEFIYRIPFLRESHFAIALFHLFKRRLTPAAAQAEFTDGLPWSFTRTNTPEMDRKKKVLVQLVKGLSAAAHDANAEFMALLLPASYEVQDRWLPRGVTIVRDFHPEMVKSFDSIGVRTLDMLPSMKADGGAFYPSRGEIHMNEKGHRFTAEALSKILLTSKLCGLAKA